MPKIQKNKQRQQSASGIKQGASNDAPLRFSFKMFDTSDEEICPPSFREGYVQILMERLKAFSAWKVSEFLTPQGKSVRNHPIDWPTTSRPDGFKHLPNQYDAYPAYQFSLTANAHGRVHGLLIDDTFHVIWLDHNHILYP